MFPANFISTNPVAMDMDWGDREIQSPHGRMPVVNGLQQEDFYQ
jgi:hypothetical protein